MADCFWQNLKGVTCNPVIPVLRGDPRLGLIPCEEVNIYHNTAIAGYVDPDIESWDYTNIGATLEGGEVTSLEDDDTATPYETINSVWLDVSIYTGELSFYIAMPLDAELHLATYGEGILVGTSGYTYNTVVGKGPNGSNYKTCIAGAPAGGWTLGELRVSSKTGTNPSNFSIITIANNQPKPTCP